MKISDKSKLYLLGVLICIAAMFIIVALVFWSNVSNYTNGSAQEVYSSFLLVVDRWLFALIVFGVLPLTFYQWLSHGKAQGDKLISVFAGIVLVCFVVVFFSGESYILQKYKDGELSSSAVFAKSTIETRIFDKILRVQGSASPVTSAPTDSSQKD